MGLTYWNIGSRAEFTSKEVDEIISHLNTGEEITFSTSLSSYQNLHITGWHDGKEIATRLSVKWTEHIDGIDVTMDVTATYGGLVEAETGKAISSGEEKVGVPYTGAFQEVTLNAQDSLKVFHLDANGTTPLTGERAQATLRGRPRGRLGRVESGKGCLRGRPRGRLGTVGSGPVVLRGRPRRFGSTQGAGATLKLSNSETLQM